MFCHPYFVGSYGLDVDGDMVGFAIGTHFMLGDVVVWSDRRNATPEEPHHSDLFLYRYSTGRQQQLTFASGAARWPRVTRNAVYFLWSPDPGSDPDRADRALCEQLLPPP